MKSIKIILEKHTDGYVAYPLGLKGVMDPGLKARACREPERFL